MATFCAACAVKACGIWDTGSKSYPYIFLGDSKLRVYQMRLPCLRLGYARLELLFDHRSAAELFLQPCHHFIDFGQEFENALLHLRDALFVASEAFDKQAIRLR